MKQLWQNLKQMSRAHLPQHKAALSRCESIMQACQFTGFCRKLWKLLSVIVCKGPRADAQKERTPSSLAPSEISTFYVTTGASFRHTYRLLFNIFQDSGPL